MILMAYHSYMLAEVIKLVHRNCFVSWFPSFVSCSISNSDLDVFEQLFHLSAILTVFFCGIVMSHYTWYNVTESSRVTTKYFFLKNKNLSCLFVFPTTFSNT